MADENVDVTGASEDQTDESRNIKSEIDIRYKRCEEFYKEWKDCAEEDFRFALGDQWTEEELTKLKEQNRPCLTFNRIRPFINLISGYQRENSARIKVSPEGGEDKIFSEVFDRALKAVDKWSKLGHKLGYLFDDGMYCGKGHIEGYLDYGKDPIRGELKFKLTGPYKVWVDPDCTEYDINEGASYGFKVERFGKRELISMYPSKKSIINELGAESEAADEDEESTLQEGDADNYGNDPNKATVVTQSDFNDVEGALPKDVKFTHKEYWYKKYVKKWFVLNRESGLPEKFDSEDDAQGFIDSERQRNEHLGEESPYFGEVKIIDREVPEMWVAAQVAGKSLQDIRSPLEPLYSGFGFFRYLADWAPSAKTEKLRVQGITRPLKDPQREKNKAKSQFLHILNTDANSGWVGDEDALTPTGWQDLEKMGAAAGITIKKKKGSELKKIQPGAPAMGQMLRERGADEEFKQISGINPDLLGMNEKNASGRAIALRVKQAVLALVRLFSNYRYTKEIIGNYILKMMPDLFDVARLRKVLGEKFIAENKLTDGILAAYLQMVKDHKYDVTVTEAGQSSTMRAEIFEQLIELAKTQYGALIPVELIIDYMDIPDGEEIKKKIQENRQQMQEAQQAGKK